MTIEGQYWFSLKAGSQPQALRAQSRAAVRVEIQSLSQPHGSALAGAQLYTARKGA
jgi:hypothetical protein